MAERAARQRRFRPYATRTYDGWDNLGDVHATLNSLERGNFNQASIMADQMWRSPRFHGVARTRLNALSTVPLDITSPRPGHKKGERLAQALGGIEEGPTPWDRMFPNSEIASLVKWGILLGIGVGELIWTTTQTFEENDELAYIPVGDGVDYKPAVNAAGLRKGRIIWRPRLRVWHPQYLRWDEGRDRYVMQTMDGEVILPDVQEEPHSDGHWIVWTPYGYRDAWLGGLVRAMGELVMDDRWNRTDWPRYNEKYARPIDKITTPSTWSAEDQEQLATQVGRRHGETTFIAEKGSDKEGNVSEVNLELVEATGTGWKTLQEKKTENDTDMAILWLGQNLTTEVSEGKGSMGVGGHQLVRRDLLKGDAHVAVCLRDQGLWHFVKFNYGNPELTPLPDYRVDPPEDQVAKSTALAAIAQAAVAMVQLRDDSGRRLIPVDERKLLEDAHIPVRDEAEFEAEAAVAEEEKSAADASVPAVDGAAPDGGAAPADDGATGDGVAPAAPLGGLKLTPSTQGAVITVNEARAASGLPAIDGPDGSMFVSDYLAKKAAELEAVPVEVEPDPGAVDDNKAKRAGLIAETKRTLALCARWMALVAQAPLPSGVVKRRMYAGLSIAVENQAGSYRLWHDPDGNETGRTLMHHDYGYIEGVNGVDKEELDCYLGPNEDATNVHIVRQAKKPALTALDEEKIMIGWHSADDARRAYAKHRDDGDKAILSVITMPLDRFKAKLARRKPTNTGPIGMTARRHRAVVALRALASKAQQAKTAARTKTQLDYADGLMKKAAKLGARTLAVDLAAVKLDLQSAKSFEEARVLIMKRFRKMNPDALADVIEKTRLMSTLAGQLSAVKET